MRYCDAAGMFDLVVEGGRRVQLQVIRVPFPSFRKSIYVPPNVILNIGDIEMKLRVSSYSGSTWKIGTKELEN